MSSAVLIADTNEDRGRGLAEACGDRGLTALHVASGPAALERALADVPDLVVAASELALIDAPQLAEILRANPRTQAVRIVLLGRERGSAYKPSLFDEILAPSLHLRDAAGQIEALLAHRARIDAVGRQTATDHEVQGQLSQIPLTDLLQVFNMNRRTGELELVRGEPGHRRDRGRVLLRDGNVIQAHVGPRVDGEKALYRLISWRGGSFAFAPHRVTAATSILTPTRSLLLEGVRQLDETERMRGSLPPLDARLALAVGKAEVPNSVHPVTQEVLLLLEIYDRVRDIVDHCTYPDYQVLRTLQTLIERGLIRLRREPERQESDFGGLFDAAQIRQLRDWIGGGRPHAAGMTSAKLLLASADPTATRDFLRLLCALPGMEATDVAESGDVHPDDVAELGHLAVGEGLGIDLLHVPTSEAYAPTWPVLAHGALGTLLLLSQPVDEAQARVRPILERLRRVRGSRLFHVLLLRKGDRVEPAQLQEKLSLLDSSSLFLLQVESGRDPVSLLRTMLARVLP